METTQQQWPSKEWLQQYCHMLTQHDLLIVAKAFVANATLETKNIQEFFTPEYRAQCSKFFCEEQIINSWDAIQKKVDEINQKEAFNSFYACSEMYQKQAKKLTASITHIKDSIESELTRMLDSDEEIDWTTFQSDFSEKKQELVKLKEEFESTMNEITFMKKILNFSVSRFQKKDRLFVSQIFSDGSMEIYYAPIKWEDQSLLQNEQVYKLPAFSILYSIF